MRIGLTFDLREDWVREAGGPQDAFAEFDKPRTLDLMEWALTAGGHTVIRIGNARRLLEALPDPGVDLVFNICEGVAGRNRESQVPVLLEMHGIPFVGADGLTLGITLDKAMAKKCFIADGVPTPAFRSIARPEEIGACAGLRYPLFVKPSCEGTSKGLTEASRVNDEAGLRREVNKIMSAYRQPALVEEFIAGREFTVAVLGNEAPEAMPVVQVSIDGDFDLGEKFFTYTCVDLEPDRVQYACPARIEASLDHRLRELAVAAYRAVGCRDFGRVDFRVDDSGEPFVLEVNPLPSLADNDVFNIFPQIMGTTYDAVLNRVVDHAAARYGLAPVNMEEARA